MNIITAEKAREISNNYLPKDIIHALNYVMLKIVENANHGDNKITLYEEDCPQEAFSQVKTDTFKDTMQKYGYKVKKELKEYYNHFYYKITISW